MGSHSESALVSELAGLLKTKPLPKELEVTILPFENDEDVDTSSFMKEGVHLGIHAPNVPKVARECRKVYYNLRKVASQRIDDINDSIDDLMDCISCLLLLCPDHATAWADRRRFLLKRVSALEKDSLTACALLFWRAELEYMNMLFTQHSKAPNAWGHRRWVCRQILAILSLENRNNDTLPEDWHPSENLIQWATLEIAVCSVIAENYPKNYYAWTHRSFIIRTLTNVLSTIDGANGRDNIKAVLETEANGTEPWLHRHVSDHSAAHYGGEALSLWLNVGGGCNDTIEWKIGILKEKLQESRRLIEKFPSHEVIWTWRRICSRLFLAYYLSFTKEEAVSFLKEEISFASSFFDESSSIDEQERDMQRHFSLAYIVWILKYTREYDFELIPLVGDINIDVIKERVRQMQMPKGIAHVLIGFE